MNVTYCLHDKSMRSACSLRTKFKDLSFSDMRRLYPVKFQKSVNT